MAMRRAALVIASTALTTAFSPLPSQVHTNGAAPAARPQRGVPLFVKRNKGRKNRRSNYENDAEDWYGKPATAEDTLPVTPVSGDFFSQFARNRVGAERDGRRLGYGQLGTFDGAQGNMAEEDEEEMEDDEEIVMFDDEQPNDDGLEEGDEFDLDSVFEEIEAGGVVGEEGEDEELGMGSTFFENKLIDEVVTASNGTTGLRSKPALPGIPLEQSTGAVTWSVGDKADSNDDDFMDDFDSLTGASAREAARAAAAKANQRIPGIGLFDPDAEDDEEDGAVDAIMVGGEGEGEGEDGFEFEVEGREYLYSPSLEKAAAAAAVSVSASPGAKRKVLRSSVRDPANNAVWVSGVHERMAKHTAGVFETLGVEFAANFDDYTESQDIDDLEIREIAALKARELYRLTGLPAIAERTGFKVEPTKRGAADIESGGTAQGKAAGYQFNSVGAQAEKLVAQLSMFGDEERYCSYTTVVCAFDGENTIYEQAEAQVSLMVAEESKMLISISTAMAQMGQRLQKEQQLRQNDFTTLKAKKEDMSKYKGGIRLREMVLKEGKVLPNQILDVSSFMNSMIDVDLMWDAAEELSARFVTMRPTKILTVATSGLILAIPMGKILQVPVVYARKERSVVMSDTFAVGYSSKTSGANKELLVDKRHIDEDDRVLLVDDFLSSGAAQEALMRITGQANATPVGVAVLLEKAYESGRMFLSGYDCQVHSLVRVLDVNDGAINVAQDDDDLDELE